MQGQSAHVNFANCVVPIGKYFERHDNHRVAFFRQSEYAWCVTCDKWRIDHS